MIFFLITLGDSENFRVNLEEPLVVGEFGESDADIEDNFPAEPMRLLSWELSADIL